MSTPSRNFVRSRKEQQTWDLWFEAPLFCLGTSKDFSYSCFLLWLQWPALALLLVGYESMSLRLVPRLVSLLGMLWQLCLVSPFFWLFLRPIGQEKSCESFRTHGTSLHLSLCTCTGLPWFASSTVWGHAFHSLPDCSPLSIWLLSIALLSFALQLYLYRMFQNQLLLAKISFRILCFWPLKHWSPIGCT